MQNKILESIRKFEFLIKTESTQHAKNRVEYRNYLREFDPDFKIDIARELGDLRKSFDEKTNGRKSHDTFTLITIWPRIGTCKLNDDKKVLAFKFLINRKLPP
jgi:hypothetical protein